MALVPRTSAAAPAKNGRASCRGGPKPTAQRLSYGVDINGRQEKVIASRLWEHGSSEHIDFISSFFVNFMLATSPTDFH
jgi:hypothetical protein